MLILKILLIMAPRSLLLAIAGGFLVVVVDGVCIFTHVMLNYLMLHEKSGNFSWS